MYICFSEACGTANIYLGYPFIAMETNVLGSTVDHGRGCEHVSISIYTYINTSYIYINIKCMYIHSIYISYT